MTERMLEAVFRALAAGMGLAPDSRQASRSLRRAYTDPAPPAAGPEERVLYFHMTPDAGAPVAGELSHEQGRRRFFRMESWKLLLTFYGPGAEEAAWRMRSRLFLDGAGQPRALLRAAGIFPVPGPAAPMLVWEETALRRRARADLVVDMRVRVNDEAGDEPGVACLPEIRIHT